MDALDRLGHSFIANMCQLSGILSAAGFPFAVIGASALLLHDVDLPRTTRDVDVAVAIEGGLAAITPLLLNAGLSSTRVEHSFRMSDGSEIDVLAIDPTWTPSHEIQLAHGDRIQAVGLPEAVHHAVRLTVETCRLSVAPLCLLTAIKLHAATAAHRPHDLEDACMAMQGYERSGERRFDVDYANHESLTLETAGAFLAGQDTARMASDETMHLVELAIRTLMGHAHLTDRFSEGLARRALLEAYRTGLHAPSG